MTSAAPRVGRPAHRAGRPALVVAACAGAAAVLVVGGVLADRADGPEPVALDPSTLVPSVPPVDPDAWIPDRLDPVPAAGTAAPLTGPFDDGAELADLRLVTAGGPAVEGTVRVTRDVSDVIVLELQAAWYDTRGERVGTDRLVLDQEDFDRADEAGAIASEHGAPLPFRIAAAPDVAEQVASSAVGLPALVHE